MNSIYSITTECLQRLDSCDIESSDKKVAREKLLEIHGLVQGDLYTAVKCEFVAREQFDNLLIDLKLLQDIQTIGKGPLTS